MRLDVLLYPIRHGNEDEFHEYLESPMTLLQSPFQEKEVSERKHFIFFLGICHELFAFFLGGLCSVRSDLSVS